MPKTIPCDHPQKKMSKKSFIFFIFYLSIELIHHHSLEYLNLHPQPELRDVTMNTMMPITLGCGCPKKEDQRKVLCLFLIILLNNFFICSINHYSTIHRNDIFLPTVWIRRHLINTPMPTAIGSGIQRRMLENVFYLSWFNISLTILKFAMKFLLCCPWECPYLQMQLKSGDTTTKNPISTTIDIC